MINFLERWKGTLFGFGTLATSWAADLTLRKVYEQPELQHELHHVKAKDGTKVAVWHYPAPGQSKEEPVLLVHGMAANHKTFTYHNHSGLIPYLCERGYDCWAVDLRGRGESDVPDNSWSFDDYAKKDLPPVVDHVIDLSSTDRLHWVGYSMGGMLFYALAGALDYQSKFGSGVTIGSPVNFHNPTLFDQLGSKLHAFPFNLKRFPVAYLLRWLGLTLGLVPPKVRVPLVNVNNMESKILRRFPSVIFGNTSSRAITQYPNWVVNQEWTDRNGKNNYRNAVGSINVPTMTVIGARDELCSTREQSGFDELGSNDKKFLLAGKDNGFSEDYSHLDLIFGQNADNEIYEPVSEWLESHPLE